MDRRVLFAALVLFAGGATGVGVAAFAFVGLDDPTPETEVVWESGPVAGDDGTRAAAATVGGETLVVQPTAANGSAAVRATAPGDGVAWSTRIPTPGADSGDGAANESGGADLAGVSPLVTGTLGGDPVVAVTTAEGLLVVLDATDGSERTVVDLGGPSGVAPAVGDPTGDGGAVVAAATADGRVVAVDAAGETAFEAALDAPIDRRPLVVAPDPDPDGDDGPVAGGVAVLTGGAGAEAGDAGDADPETVHLIGANGETRWTATPAATTVDWTAAATRRGPVLVLGNSAGGIETLEVADGSVRYDVGLQDRPVAVGEIDSGQVHVGGVGSVWAVSLLDGEVVWKQQYGGSERVNAPAVGDPTGDGSADVVVVNRRGGVLGMGRNGDVTLRGGLGDAIVYADPSFADANGDGVDEVIVVSEDGTVRALAARDAA